MRFLLVILISAVAGCSHELDVKHSQVRQQFGQTALTFATLAKTQQKAADEMAARAFANARESIEGEWNRWLDSHTNEAGDLVSSRPDGSIGPMPVRQLVDAMAKRQEKLIELAMAQNNWKEQQDKYLEAIGAFVATVENLNREEVDVQAAKESAQAAFNQVLGAIGGIAVGAGVMAPLAF